MPSLGPTELILILLVLVLLFGAKKLPDTARAMGRSLRIFKSETRGLREDEAAHRTAPPTALGTPAAPAIDPTPLQPQPVAQPLAQPLPPQEREGR